MATDARRPLPRKISRWRLPALLLSLVAALANASCGGGGGGAEEPPASDHVVTISIGEHAGLLAFSLRLLLPPGAAPSQPAPECSLVGVCRGLVAASPVENGFVTLSVASALPQGPGPATCIVCSSLTVPQGSTEPDYGCECLEAIGTDGRDLSPTSCPSTCSVAKVERVAS